jgi:pimeloyl-ACP methyl ester carboxylesterase
MFESRNRPFAPALAAALAGIALGGCHASSEGPESPPPPTDIAVANFSDVTGKVPYPFDFFFLGTTDGTLNLPSTLVALHAFGSSVNALDGWSTNAAIDTSFSLPIDPASINGNSVKIIKLWVDPTTKAPATNPNYLPVGATSPVAGVLTYGTDFTADVSPDVDSAGKFLRIIPKKPLEASKGPAANNGGTNAGKILNVGYLVVLTNGLKAIDGQTFAPDTLYASVKPPANCATLEAKYQGLCALTQGHLGIAKAVTGVDPANVILSWWFSTQSVDDVLVTTVAKATPQPTLIVPTGLTTKAVNPSLGKADIYVGSTKLPYYLTPPANANDSASVLTKYWTAVDATNPTGGASLTMFNPSPYKVADVTVPLLVTMPNATSGCPYTLAAPPPGGWPVVIFQHGITQNRTNALAVADSYASACFIVAAMDLPLHGITDTTSPFYCTPAKAQCLGATERTFNIDIQNNTTGAAGKDGIIDASGGKNGLTYFNFFNPLVFRDNLRQSEVDLGNLTKSISGLAFASATGTTPVGINPAQVHYLGHSQGAIVGGVHVHFPNDTRTIALANPGGPISLVAQDSVFYGPVAKSLVGATFAPGSYNYNMVFRDIQAVLDSGDPYNHIQSAAALHPVLLFEVKDDQTIPNSSTNALIAAGGLTKAKAIGPNPVSAGAGAYTLFTKGDHGTLLSPAASAAATAEMQKQAVLFGATAAQPGGPFVVITDPTVLDLN